MEKRWEQSSHCYDISKTPTSVGIKSDSCVSLASAKERGFAEPVPPDSAQVWSKWPRAEASIHAEGP